MKKGFLPAVFISISFVFLTWCLCQAAYADPVISVAPMSVNMGNIPVGGTSAPKTVTIINKGTSDLSLDPIASATIKDTAGNDTTEFVIQSNSCSSTIPAKGSCAVTVIFTPAKPFGKKNAVMTIASNDPKKPTVNVKLLGQAPPSKISASPMSVNFGSVPLGSSSTAKTVTIKNSGVSDLMIDSVSIKDKTGEDTTEFVIHLNSCSTIPAKSSCAITMIYTPKVTFGKKDAVLIIVSNDPKKSTLNVKLSGQAPPPKISASPMSANFGSVSAGSSSIAKTVTVKNTGISDLVIDSVSFTDPSEFSIQSNSCSLIPAKGSCAVTVAMNPTSAGSKTALMNISSNDPKKPIIAVKLSGTGLQAPYNPPDDGTTFTMSEYFPLGQGDTWTYREEDDELTVRSISGTQRISGVDAKKMIDEDGDYQLWTNSNGIVWYKEYDADDIPGCGWEQTIFNPPIHASESIGSIGSKYTSNTTLTQTDCTGKSSTASFSYEFSIEGVENVTVPAGIFNDCLKIKGVIAVNGGIQTQETTIWLAEGLGQVKSISVEKENGSIVEEWTENLVSAVVGGVHYP